MSKRKYHIETLALHAGQEPDPSTLARAVPVYRTTAFNFKSSKHGADLFALRESGNIYGRLMNPTNDVLEKRLAQLDGGAAALTLSSGTAAIYFAVTNILKQGDELVSANNLYGGTFTQFDAILPQQGIHVRFAPVNDFAATEAAINEKTRAIYIEAVGNPVLDVILTTKERTCADRGISFTAVADGSLLSNMSSMDIASLFGNALDNAIEATSKLADPEQRLIKLALFEQNSFTVVRVENYYDSRLKKDAEGNLRTTKRDDQHRHGFGVKSIRHIAQQYGGEVTIRTNDHWFVLTVLLPRQTGLMAM